MPEVQKQGQKWVEMDVEMLDKILDTLATNKSPGEDGITNEILKGMNAKMKEQIIMIMIKSLEKHQIGGKYHQLHYYRKTKIKVTSQQNIGQFHCWTHYIKYTQHGYIGN